MCACVVEGVLCAMLSASIKSAFTPCVGYFNYLFIKQVAGSL